MVAQERHPGAWMARAARQHRKCGRVAAEPGRLRRRRPADSLGTASARSHTRRALDPGHRLPRGRAAAAAPEPLLPGPTERFRRGRRGRARHGHDRPRPRARRGPHAHRRRGGRRPHDRLPLARLPLPAARAHAARRRAVRHGGQRVAERQPRAARRGHWRRRSRGARGTGCAFRQPREHGLAPRPGSAAPGDPRDAARARGHERSRGGDVPARGRGRFARGAGRERARRAGDARRRDDRGRGAAAAAPAAPERELLADPGRGVADPVPPLPALPERQRVDELGGRPGVRPDGPGCRGPAGGGRPPQRRRRLAGGRPPDRGNRQPLRLAPAWPAVLPDLWRDVLVGTVDGRRPAQARRGAGRQPDWRQAQQLRQPQLVPAR